MIYIEDCNASDLLFLVAKKARAIVMDTCKGECITKVNTEKDSILFKLYLNDTEMFTKAYYNVSITCSQDLNARAIASMFISDYRKKVQRTFFK